MALFGDLGKVGSDVVNIATLGMVGSGPMSKALGFESQPVAELAYKQEQGDLIKELQNRLSGTRPSVADIATKQNIDQGLQATLGAINSARNSSPALKARLGAQASSEAQGQMARQGSLLKAQEDAQNIANLANVIQGAQAAQMGREKMITDLNTAAQQRKLDALTGAGQGMATYAAAASDENLKENIKDTEGKARDFIEVISPKLYDYKDEKFGKGEHIGILAQDLEKSELGKSMVMDTPEGKMVDFGKGFGAVLAAVAEINEKLAQLEKKKA